MLVSNRKHFDVIDVWGVFFFSLLGSHKAALKTTLFANHTAEGLKPHITI